MIMWHRTHYSILFSSKSLECEIEAVPSATFVVYTGLDDFSLFEKCLHLTFCHISLAQLLNSSIFILVIQNRLFSSCWQLKKVTIGSTLTKIGEGAFYNCEKLRSIDYGGTAEKWASIPKGSYNYSLENVRINYNAN